MPPATLRETPALDSFTPLAEHQSQTPSTFFGTKPILHFHSTAVRVLVPRSQLAHLPIFSSAELSTAEEEQDGSIVEVVEAFVSSEYLYLPSGSRNILLT